MRQTSTAWKKQHFSKIRFMVPKHYANAEETKKMTSPICWADDPTFLIAPSHKDFLRSHLNPWAFAILRQDKGTRQNFEWINNEHNSGEKWKKLRRSKTSPDRDSRANDINETRGVFLRQFGQNWWQKSGQSYFAHKHRKLFINIHQWAWRPKSLTDFTAIFST